MREPEPERTPALRAASLSVSCVCTLAGCMSINDDVRKELADLRKELTLLRKELDDRAPGQNVLNTLCKARQTTLVEQWQGRHVPSTPRNSWSRFGRSSQ